MQTVRRSPFAVALLLCLGGALIAASLPPSANAFGTVNSLGQSAEHEKITRAALGCGDDREPPDCFEPLTLDRLAGKDFDFGAVGAPDRPLLGVIQVEAAHCDDADFLNTPNYPQSRALADRRLADCREHVQGRFRKGLAESDRLLNGNALARGQTDLEPECPFLYGSRALAKCEVLEELGRTLHGVQDFYSHSNWSDQHYAAAPISTTNPPGLARTELAPLLDLRHSLGPIGKRDWRTAVPVRLSTGCFDSRDVDEDEPDKCPGRIRHRDINKDKGAIDPETARTTDPTTRRGIVGANFQLAVRAARNETRRQWRDFRTELVRRHGRDRANLVICALTHDDAAEECKPQCDPEGLALGLPPSGIKKAKVKPGQFESPSREVEYCDPYRVNVTAGLQITRARIIDEWHMFAEDRSLAPACALAGFWEKTSIRVASNGTFEYRGAVEAAAGDLPEGVDDRVEIRGRFTTPTTASFALRYRAWYPHQNRGCDTGILRFTVKWMRNPSRRSLAGRWPSGSNSPALATRPLAWLRGQP